MTNVADVHAVTYIHHERMATLLKFFKKQCLPTSSEADLQHTVTREVNDAVKSALEEERNGANGRKRKYTHFTPEARAKLAKYVRCSVWKHSSSETLCQGFSISRREYSVLVCVCPL